MKNFNFSFSLLIILSISYALQAQNKQISFAGTGESIIVDSVKVVNLSSGISVTINGGDILHLVDPVGINKVLNVKSSTIRIYPNPMLGNSTIEIFAPCNGDAVITVLEITGKPVTQNHSYLEKSGQAFRLSGLKSGLYLINVTGDSYQFTGKILSYGQANGNFKFEKVNSTTVLADKDLSKKNYNITQDIIDMPYNSGDRLMYNAKSGIFSTVLTHIPTHDTTLTFNFIRCTDGDINSYPVVEIGTQVWMSENLKTTKYKDNSDIPLIEDKNVWGFLSSPGYCWYNNDSAANIATFGALYNWYTVNTGKLCPMGWHVPTDADWTTLQNYLIANGYNYDGITTGNKYAKALASATGWASSTHTGAVSNIDYPAKRNATGFSALPGGSRWGGGPFNEIGSLGGWWSSSELNTYDAWFRDMTYSFSYVNRGSNNKLIGFSVRCLQD